MDYAFLPPEVNSARIYSGPGPASLLAAAGSWDMVAVELLSTAEGYDSTISSLTAMYWWGPASAAMLATATPFVDWLQATGLQAKESANQARAAAAAFEQAYAMTVPPADVTANRAQLQVLIASNFFGQNTAAIAATEAQYAEMWAQDAAAMYGYAASSAAATMLTPFSSPQDIINPAESPAHSVAPGPAESGSPTQSVLSQLSAAIPQALKTTQSWWPGIIPDDFTVLDAIFALYSTVGMCQDVEAFAAGIISAESSLGLFSSNAVSPAELLPAALAPQLTAAGSAGAAPNAVTVSMSRAGSIGPMSVPPSWSAPSTGAVTAMSGTGLTTIPGTEVSDQGAPGVPGMPVGTGKRSSSVIPRYGVRLTVMSRPPAAG
ncbi:putative PPE family protein PPE29 [Mycobacterium basiliense]|uniref:Putative PPE family protein PPE29 n=1 Tax=Mycobacterium basiliense TaxID=2094119 RepID=A0A3S4BU77_9MYCO|nr:PPE family protein [Mycobacterium basiliense]VDM87788.1 putative PPE family protein PPE29 [Mycobacterium basiliense]